jgi:glycosyltransferase involved in cell wall biosynthesis
MTSMIIQLPALNEAASIGAVLDSLPTELPGISHIQVVVVDDGSKDGTGAIARQKGATVIRRERSGGVGAAFQAGLRKAVELGADVLVTMDADGQFDSSDIASLIKPIQEGEADFVSGSRFKDPAMMPDMPAAKLWGNRVIARWLGRLTGQIFYDVSCGFRAYSRSAYLRLDPQGSFTYTHEVFLALAFAGMRIKEVPIAVRGIREHGQSRVANNLFRYGWHAAMIILATYRDYRPAQFFGAIGAILAGVGLSLLAYLLVHWLNTGALFPYRAIGFIGAALAGAGLLVYLVGLVAAMLVRLRSGVETAMLRSGEMQHLLRHQSDRPLGSPAGYRCDE